MSSHEYTIKDLIEAALRRYNFNESITENQVVRAYKEVVGEFLVSLTRSASYDVSSHTLKVVFASPALKNEISYKLTDLRNSINKKIGTDEVRRIVLL